MAKRSLDSQVLTTIFSHERYISPISAANWQAIVQGITNNLASYNPIYVTLDYGCQYVRATRTSRLVSSAYDSGSGLVTATFSGKTDLDTQVSVFLGAGSYIGSSLALVPTFSNSMTTAVASLGGRPVLPVIINPPTSLTTNTGAMVAFTVDATGTAPLTYQWLGNGTPLVDGANIAGASDSVLTLAGVDETNAGNYSVVVSNLVGSVTSEVATLTVVLPPHFTSVSMSPDGKPLFSLDAVSNLTYRIDASTDLVTWMALTNLPNPTGTLQFTDPDTTNFLLRFYRAVWAR
jgi:hypothetical protein